MSTIKQKDDCLFKDDPAWGQLQDKKHTTQPTENYQNPSFT